MGCGCGRKSNTRRERSKKIEIKNRSIKLSAANKDRVKRIVKQKRMKQRLKFCKICPHSQQTKEDRRNKIKVCHKINTSVQTILNKKKITCPIGNF